MANTFEGLVRPFQVPSTVASAPVAQPTGPATSPANVSVTWGNGGNPKILTGEDSLEVQLYAIKYPKEKTTQTFNGFDPSAFFPKFPGF
jgi:hypothetical protein